MSTVDPPFTYRIEHRFGDACQVLERAPTYEAAVALLHQLVASLRALGAEGNLAIVEEAFGTTVALVPLGSDSDPLDLFHERSDAPAS